MDTRDNIPSRNDKERARLAELERNKEIRRILRHDQWDIDNGVTSTSDALDIVKYELEHRIADSEELP
jgi:hypothetical protein